MSAEAPSTLVVAVLGMGVVFVFLVFLSAMMAVLTAASGRRETAQDAPQDPATEPEPEPAGAGSPGWIAAATAAYLAAEQTASRLPAAGMPAAGMPSAAAWRPCDTAEAARWRLRMPTPATVARQATS